LISSYYHRFRFSSGFNPVIVDSFWRYSSKTADSSCHYVHCFKENIVFDEYYGDKMFFEAMQIHAVCLDAKIDEDKIRLLTYMHFKTKSNDNNVDYFSHASEKDTTSIEIMLGNKAPLESMVQGNAKHRVIEALVMDHCDNIIENIRRLDAAFRNNLGMENRLGSELKNRLRLYRDETFRKEMVQMYKDIIVPRIDFYEKPTIKRAFTQARE
jgi:hypothetical protein